jgi:KaiC/GvpD/RAD55 family RecA-like ATPase
MGEMAGNLRACHGVIVLRREESAYGAERHHISILKIRGSSFLGGPHDYVIETGGVKIFPRIVPKKQQRDFVREPVCCGIEGMDILLGGGMDRGTSNLVMGLWDRKVESSHYLCSQCCLARRTSSNFHVR